MNLQPIEQSEQIKLPRATKAKSKLARRKEKRARGRPRLDVPRTDSGQISRAKENPQQTVLAYRQARYGLTEEQARDQKASTELGRLCLSGAITQAMYDAGVKYVKLHDEMLRAIKAPVGLRKTNASGDGGDIASLDYVEWAIGAVAKWEVFRMKGWPCVEMIVIDDQPATEGLIIELRVALMTLAKRFGIVAYIDAG